jgi:hypothetical protein
MTSFITIPIILNSIIKEKIINTSIGILEVIAITDIYLGLRK